MAQRIRRLRREKGLTQGQLGHPELSEPFISMIEAGKRQPSHQALQHIATRLGVDVEHLISGRPVGLEVDLELALQEGRRDVDNGTIDKALETVSRVVTTARREGFPRTQARGHELRGLIAERVETPSAALEHYRSALALWETEPMHLRAESVSGLARCIRQLETPQMALHTLSGFRQELESSGAADPGALMRTLTAMIYPFFAAGLPEKAAEAAREALTLEARVDDPEKLACMHMAVARSLSQEGHFADALHSLRRAEEIYLAGGWQSRVAKAQINEAIVLAKKEDYEGAEGKLLAALETLDGSPNRLDEALALNELAYVSRHMGQIASALGYLERARPLLEEGDIIEQAFNERELGICLTTTDPDEAERHLTRAIDLYRIEGAAQELASTFNALADVYVKTGDTARAMQALRDGIAAVEERRT